MEKTIRFVYEVKNSNPVIKFETFEEAKTYAETIQGETQFLQVLTFDDVK